VAVSFAQGDVLTLAPKEATSIGLNATNVQQVTVSLAGNYLDAFLDSDTVDTSSGQGTFTLHAPSSPSTFSVLAVAGNTTARLDVAVSAIGFATVRVTVQYQGKRLTPIVAASAFVGTTCAQLAGAPTDGSPLVLGTYGEKLVIPSVPVDGQVAINVRIALYATGCVDVTSLTPNVTQDVTVTVFDLPLDLADTTLEARFTFTPSTYDAAALSTYFDQVVTDAVLSASFPATSDEPGRLLDAMAAASTSPTQFSSARTSQSWDGATQSWLSQHTPPTMNARAAQWLHDAVVAGTGDLTGHLAGDAAKPIFTPKTLGVLDATSAGITAPLPFSWAGQPNDVLSLTGNLTIVPSQLACEAADAQAAADVTSSTGVASAMGIDIDCAGLGTSLAKGGYAFGTCDATCMSALCSTALSNLWAAGAASLSGTSDLLSLAIAVAAPVQVGDTATVQSYAGTWVGTFGYGTSKIATQGVAKAAYGTVPN
jgi:hypothetical protein